MEHECFICGDPCDCDCAECCGCGLCEDDESFVDDEVDEEMDNER